LKGGEERGSFSNPQVDNPNVEGEKAAKDVRDGGSIPVVPERVEIPNTPSKPSPAVWGERAHPSMAKRPFRKTGAGVEKRGAKTKESGD